MKYKIHQLSVRLPKDQAMLETFLNSLKGEIISVIPNVGPFFLCYGAKINSVTIIERLKK